MGVGGTLVPNLVRSLVNWKELAALLIGKDKDLSVVRGPEAHRTISWRSLGEAGWQGPQCVSSEMTRNKELSSGSTNGASGLSSPAASPLCLVVRIWHSQRIRGSSTMSSIYSFLFIWSPIMLRALLRLRRVRMGERFGLYPRPHMTHLSAQSPEDLGMKMPQLWLRGDIAIVQRTKQ